MKTDPGEFWSRNVTVAKRSSNAYQYMHDKMNMSSSVYWNDRRRKEHNTIEIILPLVSYNTSAPRIIFGCILKISASHTPHVSPIT